MADVKWIKITTDVFDDEKILLIESLPDAYAIIVVWFKLLCLAGKMNNSGVFMMNNSIAYTDKMLATIFRMKEATVQLALQTFEQFGMIEMVDNVITIPNWGKHQSLDQLENKRVKQREYMREYREKQKQLSCNANCNTNSNSNSEATVAVQNKNKKENKNKNKIKTYSEDSSLNDAILSFVDYRKSIKKPMTDKAIELLIKKLDGMTNIIPDQIEILNQSIVNGWQGIFPLKKEKQTVREEQIPSHMKPGFNDFMKQDYGNMDDLESALLNNQDPEFLKRKEALQERLRTKYSKGDQNEGN